MESVMCVSNIIKSGKKRQEVKNELLRVIDPTDGLVVIQRFV